MEEMVNKLSSGIKMEFEVERMEPLFASQEEYDAFCKRHDSHCVKTAPLETYTGNCYLGIDAGSTTTKAALVGEDGSSTTTSITKQHFQRCPKHSNNIFIFYTLTYCITMI